MRTDQSARAMQLLRTVALAQCQLEALRGKLGDAGGQSIEPQTEDRIARQLELAFQDTKRMVARWTAEEVLHPYYAEITSDFGFRRN